MTAPEFSRQVRIETLGAMPEKRTVEAGESERAALARRFGLVAIASLRADLTLSRHADDVHAGGLLKSAVTQSCVASGAPVAAHVEAPFALTFRPQLEGDSYDEEIELAEAELDVIFYEGGAIDIGEAVAETLALNLDPYPRAPGAGDALKAAGVKDEEEAGPFASLAALRDKLAK